MDVLYDELHPSRLRYLFYAVTPNETTFATIEDVPDYTKITSAWVTVLFLTEAILSIGKNRFAFNDTVTSMTSGILYLICRISGKYLTATVYAHVYEKVHLVELDWRSPWVWILCLVTEDFAYYLAHRCMHECGIFWSFHQIHHSSEYYNLSTAMRGGVFMEFGTLGFDLLQSFFIPPQIFLVHKHFNVLYQFWLHTQLVPYLGPLEYIINTPSAHRVHHGRNRYCIDKNYGGMLILWDKLFGTYAQEKNDETIAYGLVDNVKSFNPVWLQWFDVSFFLWGKGSLRNPDGVEYFPSFKDKLFAIVAPPGYYPGVRIRRFFLWWCQEDSEFGIPEVNHEVERYNPSLSYAKMFYISSQLVFLTSYLLPFYERRNEMDWLEFIAQIGIIMSTIQIFGHYFDHDPMATFHDRLRCFGFLGYCLRYPSTALMTISILNLICIQYFESENEIPVCSIEEKKTEADGSIETKKKRKKATKAD